MKISKRFVSLCILGILACLNMACEKKPEIASLTCADFDKVVDPIQKAELQKRCPRSGPAFKHSEKKEW